MNIAPGTVAAIAASLMAQGESLAEDSIIFAPHWSGHRKRRVSQFVTLALELCQETENQLKLTAQRRRTNV